MNDVSGASPDGDRAAPASQPGPSVPGIAGIPSACELCAHPADTQSWLPMCGVAPHECYWRKGPEYTLGQSTLLPITPGDCFVPELEAHETWADFRYPQATGVFYCPNCQRERYQAAWDALIARIGPPPAVPQADAQPQPVDHP